MSALRVEIEKQLDGLRLEAAFDADARALALLGASGSGKSMTLRCIAGIEKPDRGVIRLNGRTLFDSAAHINLPPQQRRVGYVFQKYALFSHMTVEENIAAGMRRMTRTQRAQAVLKQMRAFQLEDLKGRYPGTLSGGPQQRVAIARALAAEPEALLLDEPLSALDSFLRWQVEGQMQAYLQAYAGNVIYVSHNRDEAYRLCQRIAILDAGRIAVIGDKRDVFAHPRTRAAAAITGCETIVSARAAGAYRVYVEAWDRTLVCAEQPDERTRAIGLRAGCLKAAAEEGENTLPVERAHISEGADAVSVTVPIGNGSIRWEVERREWMHYEREGLPPYLRVDPQDVTILEA